MTLCQTPNQDLPRNPSPRSLSQDAPRPEASGMPEAHTIPVRAALLPVAAVEIEVDKLDDSQHDAPSTPSPGSSSPPDTDLFDDSEVPARACTDSQEEESEASAQSMEGVEPAADHGTTVRPALSSTPSSTRPRVIHTLSNTTTPPSLRPAFNSRSVSRQGRSSSTLDLKSLGGIAALDPLTPSSPHLQTAPPPSPSSHPKTSDSVRPTHQLPPQKSPSSSLSGLQACAETKVRPCPSARLALDRTVWIVCAFASLTGLPVPWINVCRNPK